MVLGHLPTIEVSSTLASNDTLLSVLLFLPLECNPGDLGIDPTPLTFKGPGIVRVPNGTVNYTGVTVGSVAVLDCDEGYRPNFDLNKTCLFTGQWSEGTLSCELIPTGVCL